MEVRIEQDQLKGILEKAASFVNAAAPQLEKLAAYESGLKSFAVKAAKLLVDGGIIQAEDAEKVSAEVINGGFGKISEMIEFTMRHASVPAFGHAAEKEATGARIETSDDVWNRHLGLKSR